MEKKTIGKFISVLRKANGMTQQEFGDKLLVSDKTVSKWERDERMPDISLLPLLSSELGVTIDEIFNLTADQKLQRLERRLDIEEEFSDAVFSEYEFFLKIL